MSEASDNTVSSESASDSSGAPSEGDAQAPPSVEPSGTDGPASASAPLVRSEASKPPTKRELAARAEVLAKDLGIEVAISGNHAQLTELVASLEQQLAARARGGQQSAAAAAPPGPSPQPKHQAPSQPSAPPAPKVQAPAALAPAKSSEPAPVDYYVARKRSITSRRGILGPGERVFPRDVSEGEKRLDELATAGVLERRSL